MQFFDLRRMDRSDIDAKPRVRTANKSVQFTIPMNLAEQYGLAKTGKVRVRFGHGEGTPSVVLITPAADGEWAVRPRKKVMQLFVPEIYPTQEVKDQALSFQGDGQGLSLTLPVPWVLANDHLLMASKAGGKRAKAA